MQRARALLMVSVILLLASGNGETAQNFVVVSLPRGVTVELPRNWVALSDNARVTLDSSVQARLETQGLFETYEAGFAANLYDDEGRTAGIFNIRYYPELLLSQADAAAASPAETKELDEFLREQMETGLAHSGRLVHWTGTIKQVVNNKTVFLTDYVRESARRGTRFRVRLVRVFNEKKSFTMIISYRLDMEVLLAPICDRVISSLRF